MTPFQMIVSALVVLALVIILYFWKSKHPPLGGPLPILLTRPALLQQG